MRLVHWMFETRTGRVTCRVVRRTRIASSGWDTVPAAPAEVVADISVPLLLVHGEADRYFPLRHVEALAAAAPAATLWVEPGMGHAESATTPQLLERIAGWLHAVLPRLPAVCDDVRRE
jgi:pimeloyl-ACP methyl ester carboxylesterase